MSVDGVTGLSPIGQARQALGLARNLGTHADNFAKNAGRPSGMLRVPGWRTAQPGAAEDVRADWEGAPDDPTAPPGFAGPDQSGRLLIVTGDDDVQYTQLSLSMEDAEFVAQRQLSTAEIARVFRVPPRMIGAPTNDPQTYANVESAMIEFVSYSLRPWLVLIEQAITADRDLSPTTVFVEFLLDGLLRADSATRAAVYEKALAPDTGWMRREEVRRLENLPEEGT